MKTAARLTAAAVAIHLLAGCASMNDQQKTEAQATGLGAVIGAGLGAVIGNQFGHHSKTGAVIGGMIGAAAGNVYGNHVAGRKAKFAKEEDYLDACIAQADKVRQEAVAYNASLRTEIARLDEEVAKMVADLQAKKAQRQQVATLQGQLKARRDEAQKQIAKVGEEIRVQKELLAREGKSGAAQQLAKIGDEIKALEAQKAQLMEQTQQLAALNNRISV